MNINICIEKRHVYFLASLIVLFGGIFAVNALNSGNPNIMGHTGDEVETDLSNYYTKSEVDATVATNAIDLSSGIGQVGSAKYCDENGENCAVAIDLKGPSGCTIRTKLGIKHSTASCQDGEYLLTGGGQCEAPGRNIICEGRTGNGLGYLHESYPKSNSWVADCYSGSGDVCVKAYAVCCSY